MIGADPTRVLFTRSDMRLAGPARLMLAQALALRARNVEVVFASGGGVLVDEVLDLGFVHHEVPELLISERSVTATLRAMRTLHRLVTTIKPAVVHGFNAHASLCAKPGALHRRVPVFNTVHGAGKEWLLPWLPLRYVAVSGFVRDGLIAARMPSHRITVIPNATIDMDEMIDDAQLSVVQQKRRAALDSGVIELCKVAMFTGGKGQDLVIDLVAELDRRSERRVWVTFVGDGVDRQRCEERARALGIADRCEFVGAQSDVQPFLDRASMLVHLSRAETFGLVLIEAGARGLPVFTHSVGGIPEVVVDGTTGMIGPYSDVPGLADLFSSVPDDWTKLEDMGEAGRARVRSEYLTDVSADRLLDLYGLKGSLQR